MPPAKHVTAQTPCPCGNTKNLGECCLPYIEGKSAAPTAELLMRSRYTAHVLVAVDYLWETWSPEKRIRSNKHDIQTWAASCEWLGLHIIKTEAGQPGDTGGLVSFVATFRQNGQVQVHQEVSLFTNTLFGWRYLDHQET